MRFARRLAPSAGPGLVPLIDVVLNLVFFFMVSATFITAPGIKLKLPTSSTSEEAKVGEITVAVKSLAEVWCNGQLYTLEEFDKSLPGIVAGAVGTAAQGAAATGKTASPRLSLEIAEELSFADVVGVWDVLRGHGLGDYTIRTARAVSKESK